jgi:regulator of protease activity HflC (stomatin/prohibitin superfamily)
MLETNIFCAIAIGIILILTGIQFKVVPEHHRLVVFRLGRPLDKPKGPGVVFLFSFLDRFVDVDLQLQRRELSNETARTQNSVPVLFSFYWQYKVIDPIKSIVEIGNQEAATVGIAATSVRALLAETNSSDILTNLLPMNKKVHARLNEVTERWGVIVTDFEILKIVVDEHQKEIDKANFNLGTQ